MKNILILGCGNIAGLNESKKSSSTFSHAKAISRNSFFNLKYCYDVNKKKLLKFKKKWGVKKSFSNFNDILKNKHDIDIVVIASPAHTHHKLLKDSFKLSPKIIICEKPMCLNLKQGLEIAKKIPKGTKIFINYQRRLFSSYIKLKEIIRLKKYGKLRSISATYNKGLFNNGSHLVDIFNYLLVSPSFQTSVKPINDYKSSDLTYPFFLKKNSITISVNVANAKDYYFFHLQFVFQKKIIEIIENEKKFNYFVPIKTKTYKKFTSIKMQKIKRNKDQFDMNIVYKNIKIFIKNNKHKFLTEIQDEIQNMKILQKILNVK